MSAKSSALAFSGYTPGPDLDSSPDAGVQAKPPAPTFLSARIAKGFPVGAPVQQFTPDQEYFRRSVADGRWQADYGVGAHAPVYHSKQDPITGAVDVRRLEPFDDPDSPQYLDLGGKGGVSYGVKRP